MLQFIKSIFTKEKNTKGQLFVQNAPQGEAVAVVSGDALRISVGKEDTVVTMRDMKDLRVAADGLVFSVLDKKYRFVTADAQALYSVLHPFIASTYLHETDSAAYLVYNGGTRTFDPYPKPVVLRLYEDVHFYLRVEDDDTIVHFEEINTDTQYYVDQPNLSFVWSIFSDNRFFTFCLRFSDPDDFLGFRKKYIECCYKSANNKEECGYTTFNDLGAYNDPAGKPCAEDGQKTQDKNKTSADIKENPSNTSLLDDFLTEDRVSDVKKPQKGFHSNTASANELLVMGNGQCYVTRGPSLGVFDLEGSDLRFRTQVVGALENPQKIITHNGDTSLVILDKNDRERLGLLDLSRGEVIERWDVGCKVNDCFDSTRGTNDGTLVGLSDYSLLRIDPRTAERVVAKKEYKTKNEFSCGTATGAGSFAVASRKGDLRLYDRLDRRAKTLLPGFGDEVRGIDTSRDGSLILCTCRSYILLFSVSSNYSKNSKDAVPVRLQLKPQHLAHFDTAVCFSPAKFDKNDSVVVTSTGRFVVKWEISDVLEGRVYAYSLKALGECVVDEDFVVNGRDIIVATRNDVRKLGEGDLRRPRF